DSASGGRTGAGIPGLSCRGGLDSSGAEGPRGPASLAGRAGSRLSCDREGIRPPGEGVSRGMAESVPEDGGGRSSDGGTTHVSAGPVELLQRLAVAANEARDTASALRTCLSEVCAYTGWEVGHAFLREDDTGMLVPSGVWHSTDEERFRDFRALTEGLRFAPGEGVAGRVLRTGEPEWLGDVSREPDFRRGHRGGTGLRAAFLFPILVGREVVGVLEFFSTRVADPDQALLNVMSQVGVQVGRVVERERAEEALRLSEAKFMGIISISSDAIVSVDGRQRIIFFNRGAEQIFG